MDILCCPACGSRLGLHVHEEVNLEGSPQCGFPGCRDTCALLSLALVSEEARRLAHAHCPECYRKVVREGALTCSTGHRFAVRRFVPRLNLGSIAKARTKRTFDVEWTAFRYDERIYGHSQSEEFEDFFLRTGVGKAFLEGKTILDAGCGIGRLTQSVGRVAKEVVGMDFSEGVDEAWSRTREEPNVHVIQGDLMKPPFREAYFDYVYCKGVLHYVPDVRACLSSLARRVVQGGALSVTIFPKMSPSFERFNDLLRRGTTRLPLNAVYVLSHLLIPLLFAAWRCSGVDRRPVEWKERAHMIFNWLSSEYLNRASNETMEAWFREFGFGRVRLSVLPVGITGEKTSVT